jgi:hypothetical protein
MVDKWDEDFECLMPLLAIFLLCHEFNFIDGKNFVTQTLSHKFIWCLLFDLVVLTSR